jgi:hypothetical protein
MAAHLLVHGIHIALLLFHNIPQQALICRLADICWTYASIEVVLLGIFAVHVRFLLFNLRSLSVSHFLQPILTSNPIFVENKL